jgi:hypothetical protein
MCIDYRVFKRVQRPWSLFEGIILRVYAAIVTSVYAFAQTHPPSAHCSIVITAAWLDLSLSGPQNASCCTITLTSARPGPARHVKAIARARPSNFIIVSSSPNLGMSKRTGSRRRTRWHRSQLASMTVAGSAWAALHGRKRCPSWPRRVRASCRVWRQCDRRLTGIVGSKGHVAAPFVGRMRRTRGVGEWGMQGGRVECGQPLRRVRGPLAREIYLK